MAKTIRQQEYSRVDDVNVAFKQTLSELLESGTEIHAAEGTKSVGSGKKFKEILNYNFVISNPTQRLLPAQGRGFNLPGAIARFVWMMAANNRLADIEFYWGVKVSGFSDDGYTVPGSSYGARMFNASPGLDQIEAVIKRLKEDPSTRRAAVSIYHPIDAIRASKDIPCTFGIFYHIRDKKLVSTVVMRSNNAFILLPYNVFEFSLLAEIIAREVGVEMGDMYYNALSMHVYEDSYEKASAIVGSVDDGPMAVFPPMPHSSNPMVEVKKLIRLESKIRHISAGLNNSNIGEWLKDTISLGKDDAITLDPYWRQFYLLLLYFIVSKKTADKEALQKVAALITKPFSDYLDKDDMKMLTAATQQDLFGDFATVNPAYADFSHAAQRQGSLDKLCQDYNNETEDRTKVIDLSMYIQLRNELVGDLNKVSAIAARGQAPEIDKTDFDKAVNKLISGDRR